MAHHNLRDHTLVNASASNAPVDTTNADRANNFGILRLVLAALVIVSHAPILLDGGMAREPLSMILGPVSFGQIAVDGFFLVSGYLITKSFVERASIRAYIVKRALRIAPAYVVCFAICVAVVAPLAGGTLTADILGLNGALLMHLMWPYVPDVFPGLPYPTLNGSMWTIAYEARCYIATIALGLAGLYTGRLRVVVPALAAACLCAHVTGALDHLDLAHKEIWGEPRKTARLVSFYLVGASYFLYRDRVLFRDGHAAMAALAMITCLPSPTWGEAAVAVFGSYVLFWFAFTVRARGLDRFNTRTDISYGLYLYGWPIASLLIAHDRAIDPRVLCVETLGLAALAGYASWIAIERPALALARARRARSRERDPAAADTRAALA